MSKLGPELGVSDVGLAKGCRRHGIPVPPAGYWARVAAGQKPPRPALPEPEKDFEVYFPLAHETERSIIERDQTTQLAQASKAQRLATALPEVEMRPTLEGCHPLVKAAAKFFAGIQPAIEKAERISARATAIGEPNWSWMRLPKKSYGRYTSGAPGQVIVAATLRHIDWIMRFHDALLRGLIGQGCKVRSQGPENHQRVAIRLAGEELHLSFAEEFDKFPSGREYGPATYVPRDTFKVKVERSLGGPKQWVGTAPMLESQLAPIVRAMVAMLRAQAKQRVVQDAAAAVRRIREEKEAAERAAVAAAQALRRERAAARKAQLDRANFVAAELDKHAALERLLQALEARIGDGPADDVLRTWLALVRSQVANPLDQLVDEIRAEGDSDAERPIWWPPKIDDEPD